MNASAFAAQISEYYQLWQYFTIEASVGVFLLQRWGVVPILSSWKVDPDDSMGIHVGEKSIYNDLSLEPVLRILTY